MHNLKTTLLATMIAVYSVEAARMKLYVSTHSLDESQIYRDSPFVVQKQELVFFRAREGNSGILAGIRPMMRTSNHDGTRENPSEVQEKDIEDTFFTLTDKKNLIGRWFLGEVKAGLQTSPMTIGGVGLPFKPFVFTEDLPLVAQTPAESVAAPKTGWGSRFGLSKAASTDPEAQPASNERQVTVYDYTFPFEFVNEFNIVPPNRFSKDITDTQLTFQHKREPFYFGLCPSPYHVQKDEQNLNILNDFVAQVKSPLRVLSYMKWDPNTNRKYQLPGELEDRKGCLPVRITVEYDLTGA